MRFKLVENIFMEANKKLTSEIILQVLQDTFHTDTAKAAFRDFILPDGSFVSTGSKKNSHAFAAMLLEERLEELGYNVNALQRTRVANIEIGKLRPGTFRKVTGEELEELYRLVE